MKVLQVTTNYPTEKNPIFGIFMKEQVESLAPFGVQNTIFFSNGSESHVGRKGGGAFVHLKSVFKLQWHLLTHQYDLIHCHSNISGLIFFLSGGWIFHKCVISFQNDPEKFQDAKLFNKLYPFFNKVIVKLPTKYLSRKKVVYLPNGCNTDFFRPMDINECKNKLGLDPEKDYFLYVDSNTSRKRTQKRKDRFDETMQILRKEYGYHNIEELVMIGVSRENVPYWMNASTLHLLTSDEEGSPNSVKECIFCNTPVVATPVGNVKDMLADIPGVYVTNDFDARELAAACDKVLRNKGAFMGREKLLRKGYGMGDVSAKLYRLYKDVLEK